MKIRCEVFYKQKHPRVKTIGIDVGSSSVKVSLMDAVTGRCVASAAKPDSEMPITALKPGWAEQDPAMWWRYVCEAIREIGRKHDLSQVAAVGVTHQMHSLVCIGRGGNPLRKAVIWCDNRAVPYGERAFAATGEKYCLEHLLNSPGNFTASRMAWLKDNEPAVFDAAEKFIGTGDYIVFQLTGEISTTRAGLSEQMLWDYPKKCRADFILDYFGIPPKKIPDHYDYSIGLQGRVSAEAERLTGIPCGKPVTYRVGDQPNNAFSLGATESGQMAATGGTSGVLCAVTDQAVYEPGSRVNTFLHASGSSAVPRYTILACITAAGILYAWARRMFAPDMTYDQINSMCAGVAAGSGGITVLPFGNGAERMFANRNTGASVYGINVNIHTKTHILRAVQEGIAYNFRYAAEIFEGLNIRASIIRAGSANLFLSPVFRQTLATLLDTEIELCNTDGSLGAARGAALGAGLYRNATEALSMIEVVDKVIPHAPDRDVLEEGYTKWREKAVRNFGEH